MTMTAEAASNHSPSKNLRCTLSQLRRAAGSKSLQTLRDAIATGWTPEEVNTAGQDGKTALHMAAWKGSLDNVRYLIETLQCDVNLYSRFPYAYGKTAIFFAATQSRVDVMEYLLFHTNAKVTIVNNKGQSVSSIASSHDMPEHILSRITELEEVQQDWWNFRATHSDGLEYGDLDYRFLDRPIRPNHDVVKQLVVNPTTKATRKGGWARRNPQKAKQHSGRMEKQQIQQQQPQKQQQFMTKKDNKYQVHSTGLTVEEQEQWDMIWDDLSELLGKQETETIPPPIPSVTVMDMLLELVRLGKKQRRPWIQESVERIRNLLSMDLPAIDLLLSKSQERARDEREVELLEKMRSRIFKQDEGNGDKNRDSIKDKRQNRSKRYKAVPTSHQAWTQASIQVQQLSIKDLECNQRNKDKDWKLLTLPKPPTLIDTSPTLYSLWKELRSYYAYANDDDRPFLIAVDAEWYEVEGLQSHISTIQIAYLTDTTEKQGDCSRINTYVIDLTIRHNDYKLLAMDVIRWIVSSKNLLILGFALSQDIHMLERFIGVSMDQSNAHSTFLDLQVLFNANANAQPMGLKACAASFSNIPLSKKLQCSEWGRRPLSLDQVEYAGLDAAILLVLLSEHSRQKKQRHNSAQPADSA